MKKINFIYGLLAILFVSLVACKKDEVPTVKTKDLTLEMTDVTLSEGETKMVKITSGNGDYKALSLSRDVVSAEIKDNSVELKAKKSGESKVTVTDAKGKTVTINVKVTSSLTIDGDMTVILHKGATKSISILTGEGKYTVESSNNDVATVVLKDSSVEITAVSVGEAVIKIIDTVTKEEKTISVSVKDLMISENEVKVYVGKTEEITVSGSEGFTLSDNDDNIATATFSENKITITGVAVGTTKLKVTDTKTKQEAEVAITVSEELVLTAYSIEVPRKGENTNIIITNYKDKEYEYMDQYDLEVTEGEGIIELTKQHYDGIGHHIKVKSKGKIGTAKFKIKDKNTNEEKEVTVTITPVTLNISLYPKELTLQVGETKEVKFIGNGNYEISEDEFVTATANESDEDEKATLLVTGIKEGETTITITDTHTEATDKLKVTITPEKQDFVVDENGVLQSIEPSAVVENLVIPESVKSIPDYFYSKFLNKNKVKILRAEGLTTIGYFGLKSLENLEEVILGKDLKELGNYVFHGSTKIKKVTVKATTPPANVIGRSLFSDNISKNATLYVPEGSVQAYKDSHWNQYFKAVLPIEE